MADAQRVAAGGEPSPQQWVVLAVRGTQLAGVLGPFDSEQEAQAWASGVRMRPGTDWSYFIDEVLPPSIVGSAVA